MCPISSLTDGQRRRNGDRYSNSTKELITSEGHRDVINFLGRIHVTQLAQLSIHSDLLQV